MPADLKKRDQKAANLTNEIESLLKGIRSESKKKYAFWEEVMGYKIAGVASPIKIKKNVLYIKVQDATWRFELSRRKLEIKDMLNEHMKKSLIKDIVFI